MHKIINYLKGVSFISGDSSLAQLFRTYVVGSLNLVIGLISNFIFQFYVFNAIAIPLRTYLTNIGSFIIGVMISYLLSRKIIFKLSYRGGNFKEFTVFLLTNLVNLFLPLIIWYFINIYRPIIQENELQFLIATVLIHGSILPLKYLFYKFFVFKDSLNS